VSNRRAELEIDCQRDDLDPAALAAIAHRALDELCARLQLALPTGPIRVIVGADGTSSANGRELVVVPRAAGNGYTTADWFELLFAHEVAHLLVQEAWGMPPVLIWEGLPVHLGDDRTRTRLFGHTYHAYCRALDALASLLPLAPLLRASTYYRRRGDVRVDLQAGSFCAFLLETHGPSQLGGFIRASVRPTTDPPEAVVDPGLVRWLGADLRTLEAAWIASLRAHPAAPALVERFRGRPLGTEPDRRAHCDRCFAPTADCRCPP
jgi:hypothetical protein